MLEVVFSIEDFKNQYKTTIWEKSNSHYTMISVSKGNKQKYAQQLQIINSGSGGIHGFYMN